MNFEEAIKQYIDGYASKDPAFFEKYRQKNKSIKGCCNYIISEAQKQQQNRCAVISDDQVFQWARHYFEEDDETLGINERATTQAETQVKVEYNNSSEKPPVEAKKPPKQKKEVKKDYEQVDMFAFLGEA